MTPDADDVDWEEISEDEAFQVGVLTELSMIRRYLEAIATSLDADVQPQQPESDESDIEATRYRCLDCDAVVDGTKKAERHAVDDHGAPADGETWRAIMSEVEP